MKEKPANKTPLDLLPALAGQNKEKKNGVIVILAGEKAGSAAAKELLYEITDSQTVLFLSGGKTPAGLYSELAKEKKLEIAAAAMVDERFGKPGHVNSNELMIKRTGLADYFEKENIPFYRILADGTDLKNTAWRYDETVRNLLSQFPVSLAILGIGEDGHIAGIAPQRADFSNPLFSKTAGDLIISYFKDPKPMSPEGNSMSPYGFGERITMTIRGLLKMDFLIILAFGQNKERALKKLFEEGPVEQLPARLIKNKQIAGKTVLISDRRI